MEVLRRSRWLADLDIVVRRELQVALNARARVLRTLALVSVRQQHHNARKQSPLRLASGDELVDDDLRAVREVAELRLPKHQRLRIVASETVLKPKHRCL